MSGIGNILSALARAVGLVFGTVLVLVLILLGVLGFTNFGARIVTERVAAAISNRDMTVRIEDPSALLTGGLRSSRILLSDTRGVYAELKGLSIDWNPTALLSARFHATNVEVASIDYMRPPIRTLPKPQQEDGGGFSLPLRIAVDHISLPDIRLAQAVTGRAFALAAQGNLAADSEGGNAFIQVNRQAVADAKLTADLAYRPSENRLQLNAELSEPKGGLVAGFLALPGEPAVKLDLHGEGPISDWRGRLQAALDGQERAAIDAHHTLAADNIHHLDLKGGGDFAALLPAPFRPLFAGQTNLDISTAFDNQGKIDIQTGNIATGSVVIAASGTIDPRGKNSLNANVLGTAGPVDFRWPLAEGEARLMISGINLALTGDAKASRLTGNVSLDSATLPQANIASTKLTLKSDSFNLASQSGAVQVRLVVSDADIKNADVNRLLQGSLNLGTTLQISPDAIGFNGTTLDTGTSHAKLNGAYQRATSVVTGNTQISVDPGGLPPALATRLTGPLTVESQISGTLPSKIALTNFRLNSDLVQAAGNLSLDDQTLDAALTGRLNDLGKVLANTKGGVDYDVSAKGLLTNLALTANMKADVLEMAGRPVKGLQLSLNGNTEPKGAAANLTANGTIDNQPIAINANASLADGLVAVPKIDATVGSNKLTGELSFDTAFLPKGSFSFDLPDIGLMAALAGQEAAGDLKGAIDIASASGKTMLDVKANGERLQAGAISIAKPDIALAVSDLKALAAKGVIKADEIANPASKLVQPVVTLDQSGDQTSFKLNGTYDEAPVSLVGALRTGPETLVTLETLSARPRGIPIELANPAHATIGQDGLRLDRLTLKTGNGSIDLSGSAGKALELHADIKNLPASLANNFVRDLAAEGIVSGTVDVTGEAKAPVGDFKLAWKDAATNQTRMAGLAPLAIGTDGKLTGNQLTFTASAVGGKTLSLKAAGTYDIAGANAGNLNATADIVNVPAELANGFVPNLDAEGALSGKAKATGKLSAPVVDFDLALKDAATRQTKAASLAKLNLTSTGRLENNVLSFKAQAAGKDGLSLSADGSYSLAGSSAQLLDVNAKLAKVPASLVNPFVPDIDASGLISGSLQAKGKLPRPAANFDLIWTDAATRQTRAAKLSGTTVTAKGNFADEKLDASAKIALADGAGANADARLQLNGTAIAAMNVNARLDRIPAALANGFVPNLDAAGMLSGTLVASGTLEQPTADLDMSWSNAATNQTRAAHLAPLEAKTTAHLANGALQFDTSATDGSATQLTASGTAHLEGTTIRDLQANADLKAVPASLLNSFRPDLDAKGTISATAKVAGSLPKPAIDFTLNWDGASTAQTKTAGLSTLTLKSKGTFADSAIAFNADLSDESRSLLKADGNVSLNGNAIGDLKINADIAGVPASIANGFVPGLEAEGLITGSAKTSGSPDQPVVDFNLDWKNAAIAQIKKAGLSGLSVNASGRLEKGQLEFRTALSGGGLAINGDGTVMIAGTEAKAIKANATIVNVPAKLANGFLPGLDADGVISGKVSANGTLPVPDVDFDLAWKDARTQQTKAAAIGPLSATAKGTIKGGKLDFNAGLSGSNVSLKANGSYGLTGDSAKTLDLKADLANVPAGIANAFVPNIGAQGVISGSATANGKLPTPNGEFRLTWKNAGTSQTKSAGLQNLTVAADGKLANGRLTFNTNLSGGGGLTLKGGGNVGLAGARPLDLNFNGSLPFGLLGAQLSAQGFSATGTARVDLKIAGTASAPVINGNLSTSGAKFVDVRRNLAINNVQANIDFNGRQATITRLSGQVGGGGSISASGTVGIDPAGGFPADIQVKLDRAVYVDGTLVVATIDGTLGLKGQVTSTPTLSGQLRLEKASITVPAKLPSSLQKIRIKHVDAPTAVRAQLKDMQPVAPRGKSSTINLDITLDAPSQIFVRGRGIDAELGGRIGVKGTAAAPEVTGGFTMRRGRLTILNRRLDFTDKSRITFAGDLTPALNMEASSTSGSTTLTVDVAGVATDPDITFSSSPALPQDEVLAQLIFGQSMSKLSPVQIAQLADAVSQLAGGRSTSLFEGLRNQLGVDDLDVSTDAQGRTSVSVGRYINEKTYFELKQGEDGPKAVINLDVGRGVKLRAGAGGAGSGEAGVVYEHEY
ncbi:translocation/assembly module TamB domain-containing protein [Oryzifoliimicrobium ureilyticus]|uniref:translocation/assembly module TamB domain-containing protein n=1 Tax=Oryzifoliimicrobium ureilyticus TaxID=3113724 RepID=UPI0030766905